MQTRQLLTVKEVAQVLRLSPAAFHIRLKKGDLAGLRTGAQWQFSQETINTGLPNAAAPQETKE